MMKLRVVYASTMLMFICIQNSKVEAQSFGEDCAADATVCNTVTNGKCDTTTSKCGCEDGFFGTDETPYNCIEAAIGADCSNAVEPGCGLITNGVCSGGTCACKPHHYGAAAAKQCERVMLGDSCAGAEKKTLCESIDSAECTADTNICQCTATYFGDDGTAVCTQVKLGVTCTAADVNECEKITYATCTDGNPCTCNDGYSGAVGTTTCYAEATVTCTKTDTAMTMTIRAEKNTKHQQIATLTSTTKPDLSKCIKSEVKPNQNFLELAITVSISDREQTDPPKGDKDCIVAKDATTTTKVSVTVIGQAHKDYIQTSDLYYTASCDSDDATGDTIQLNDVGITPGITAPAKPAEKDDVTLTLVKALDDTDLTPPVSLNEEVKLKVTLNRKPLPTVPLGVFLFDLTVADKQELTDQTTKQLKMINNHGCVEDNDVFKPETTFVPVDKTIVAETAIKFETLTGKFNLALFVGMTTLELFFSVKYDALCFVNTQDECFDLANYCKVKTGRRRRSVEGVQNGTATLSVRLDLNKYHANNQGGSDSDSAECKTSRDFWIVTVVLGCLVTAVLLFSFFLFYRLKNEQRRSDKIETFGARNPAF